MLCGAGGTGVIDRDAIAGTAVEQALPVYFDNLAHKRHGRACHYVGQVFLRVFYHVVVGFPQVKVAGDGNELDRGAPVGIVVERLDAVRYLVEREIPAVRVAGLCEAAQGQIAWVGRKVHVDVARATG